MLTRHICNIIGLKSQNKYELAEKRDSILPFSLFLCPLGEAETHKD